MPIKRCSLPNGGTGYKYGNSGTCYRNRKDAIKQMQAIKVSQQKHGKSTLLSRVFDALKSQITD